MKTPAVVDMLNILGGLLVAGGAWCLLIATGTSDPTVYVSLCLAAIGSAVLVHGFATLIEKACAAENHLRAIKETLTRRTMATSDL